jgi:hypothetical protein
MTAKLSRRSALTVIAAAGVVPAGGAGAACVAADDPDAELRRLWSEYQRLVRLSDAARDAHQPFRDAADAKIATFEGDPRGADWAAWIAFSNECRAEPNHVRTWGAYCAVCDVSAPVIRAIHSSEAKTLFGVAVKLAAVPLGDFDDQDMTDAGLSVLRDIDRLLGTDFFSRNAERYGTGLSNWGLNRDDD